MSEHQAEPVAVQVGAEVEVEFELIGGERDRLQFHIVPDASADFARGFLGVGTPLAQAILGHPAGAELPYQAEDVRCVRILSVQPSTVTPPKDVQKRRAETLRKAVEHSDRTNAILFASSFSGKWGDYDPTGFEEEEGEQKTDE